MLSPVSFLSITDSRLEDGEMDGVREERNLLRIPVGQCEELDVSVRNSVSLQIHSYQ